MNSKVCLDNSQAVAEVRRSLSGIQYYNTLKSADNNKKLYSESYVEKLLAEANRKIEDLENSNAELRSKLQKKDEDISFYEKAECYPVGAATFDWIVPKFGFGQMVIRRVHTKNGIKVLIDSETMSKNFLIEILTKMVENAELK